MIRRHRPWPLYRPQIHWYAPRQNLGGKSG